MTATEQRNTHKWQTMALVMFGLLAACLLLVSGASAQTGDTDGRSLPVAAPRAVVSLPAVPQATGTPCNMNSPYSYVESTGAIVPGTQDLGIHCDDCTIPVDLPFAYNLYGQSFTSAIAGSNGMLAFVTNGNDASPNCLPAPTSFFQYAILPHWEDLRLDGQGTGIYTSLSGSSPNRIFNIEWRAIIFIDELPVNFEVRLYEGQNRFDLVYGEVSANGGAATVGTQRDSSLFTEYECQSGGLDVGLLLIFTQPTCDTPTSTTTPGGPTLTSTSTSTLSQTALLTNTSTATYTPLPPPPPVETCGTNSNYTVAQATGAIVPGTQDMGNHCVNCLTRVDLPFNFAFYGQEFNSVNLSSFGVLEFNSNYIMYANSCLPNTHFYNAIFANWDNLTTLTTGCTGCGIYTSVSGSSPNRIFNIEWRADLYYEGGHVNFEIRLYEGQNRFDLVYGQMDGSGSSATVGAQRDTGSHFTQWECNTSALVPDLLLVFTQPVCPTPTGTPPTATITRTPTVTRTPITACGPGANYLFATATATMEPGTTDIGNHCDDCMTTVTLPFTYNFYGQPFNSANISTNGTIQFTSNDPVSSGLCLPATSMSDAIVPYWEDLDTRTSGGYGCTGCGIFTSVSGSAPNRIFNIEWRATYIADWGRYINFEVRLYESLGRFDMVYADVDAQRWVTVGAQRGLGTQYVSYACFAPGVSSGLLITFTEPDCITGTATSTPTVTNTRQPVATCGPNANYLLYQTHGSIEPGTDDIGNHCQYCTTPITLPFTYNFYGQPFNSANISSSGNIQFSSDFHNDIIIPCLPTSTINNAIFAHWTALYTGCPGCGIFTSVSGTAPNRIFNIEWRGVEQNGADYANFEVRLYEAEARFDIVYGVMENGGRVSTVGAQRDTGSHFTQYTCNSFDDVLHAGLMLIFAQPECNPSTPTPTITPGGPTFTPTATWTATPCPGFTNYSLTPTTGATLVPGVTDTGNNCNDCTTEITMPFVFSLYGSHFVNARVDSNGTLQFLSNHSYYQNYCLPTLGNQCYTVYPYWDNLSTEGAGAGIYTSISGSSPNRIFNIEWRACLSQDGEPCSSVTVNFEVRLYEGQSKFDIIYGDVDGNGSGATIGVAACGGDTYYTQYSCNIASVDPGLKLTFVQVCGTPPPTSPTRTFTPTRTGTPPTFTPTGVATPASGAARGHISWDGRVPAEWPAVAIGTPFRMDLMVDSSSYSVVAAQSFLTYTSSILQVVAEGATSCSPAGGLMPDMTTLDDVTQNEVCNGPGNCAFRGNLVGPGSIAFASGAMSNCPGGCRGDFRVASIAFCAVSAGTAHIHWLFSPPAPPNRHTAILDESEHVASIDPVLYTDYIVHVVGTGSTPTLTTTRTPVATPVQFTDVHPTDYFYTSVMYLASHGVISGYSDGAFRPYNNTTRGQLSKIVVLAEGWSLNTAGGPHFSDVPSSNPFYGFVETAYNRGVISGYANHTFRPGNNITRGQLSKIIVLARGWAIDTRNGPHFADVALTDSYYAFVETIYNHGVVSGYSDHTFRPGNNATRGQISKIVYEAIRQP